LAAETDYALTALVEGRIWTDLYVESEGQDHSTIVISVSADSGDDFVVIREHVGDGMIVSHAASLRNAPKKPIEQEPTD